MSNGSEKVERCKLQKKKYIAERACKPEKTSASR
jgi:hypothetical protein